MRCGRKGRQCGAVSVDGFFFLAVCRRPRTILGRGKQRVGRRAGVAREERTEKREGANRQTARSTAKTGTAAGGKTLSESHEERFAKTTPRRTNARSSVR